MDHTLIIGYGNIDRQDDGVAWHVLTQIAGLCGMPGPFDPGEGFPLDTGEATSETKPDLLYTLQLTPELAETIANYQRVCFVDAHTGAVPEEIHFARLNCQFQNSPFTHHLTPQSCLALSQALYGISPQAILVSIRGYEFGFSTQLSARTQALLPAAVDLIWQWLKS